MREDYKGYRLSTTWDNEAFGYGFRVCGKDGGEVSRSIGLYFHEENALQAAREAADALLAQK